MLADIVASATRTVVVGHGVSGAVLRGLNLGLDAKAMFVLEKPQDAFFRLLAGVEERIACSADAPVDGPWTDDYLTQDTGGTPIDGGEKGGGHGQFIVNWIRE